MRDGVGTAAGAEGGTAASAERTACPCQGLVDLDILGTLVKEPVADQRDGLAGCPPVAELRAPGIRRISVGTAITQTAYGVAWRAATELLTNDTYDALADSLDFAAMNDAVTR